MSEIVLYVPPDEPDHVHPEEDTLVTAEFDPTSDANRARNFAFVAWEPFPPLHDLKKITEKYKVTYFVMGRETAPTTGKLHLQCFISFKNAILWTTVREKIFPYGRDIKRCRKCALANARYCKKDEDIYFEYGTEPTGSGARTDYTIARQLVKTGCTYTEYIENVTSFPALHAFSFFQKAYRPKPPKHRTDREVIWVWGPTGTSKTYRCQHNPDWGTIHLQEGDQWWCGYDAHETVILDEFRDEDIPWKRFLRICGGYCFKINQKHNGLIDINPKRIVFTSPNPPDKVYIGINESRDQFMRRFTKIIHSTTPYVHPTPRVTIMETW